MRAANSSIDSYSISTVGSPVFSVNNAPSSPKLINLNFTEVDMQGYRQNLVYSDSTYTWPVVTLKDCQMRGVLLSLNDIPMNGSTSSSVTLQNDLWERCTVQLFNGNYSGYQNPLAVTLYNNTFWSNTITLWYEDSGATYHPAWTVNDNLFDGDSVSFTGNGSYSTYIGKSNNAHNNTTMPSALQNSGYDVSLTSLTYATGPLGNRYIGSSSSTLVNVGSRTASAAGLADHTILADQTADCDTGDTVDIGFHYKASAIRPGFNQNTLPIGDDNSTTSPVGLPFTMNFFGTSYSSLYVNQNGNVTFNRPFDVYDYEQLSYDPSLSLSDTSAEYGLDIVAPFWGDVDTQSPCSALATYGTGTVYGHAAFGVNWVGVGGYDLVTYKLNSFQLIFIDRSDRASGDYDVEFNYTQIQWESGAASGGPDGLGGNAARVGFAGDEGAGNFEMIGSGPPGNVFLDSDPTTGLIYNDFNTCLPGRYIFQFHNGAPIALP
jgi:hypothetical protein